MSLLLLWNAGVAVTPPVTLPTVGARVRRRRVPYRPNRPRVEAVVRTLAEDLLWEPPVPQFATDNEFLELMLIGAFDEST